jgi:ADP-heptose:LPS heptosyltransferase
MKSPRILLITEGQLGDQLLLTPALRALKTSFPDGTLSVMVVQRRSYGERPSSADAVLVTNPTSGTAEVLTLSPYVDDVIEIHRSLLRSLHGISRIRAELTIIRHLRARRFDTVICCFPEDRFVIWALLSGASTRIGQKDQGFRWLLSKALEIRKERGGVLKYYCSLATAAGARVDSDQTEFIIPEESRQRARKLLESHGINEAERFAVVHPGASGPYRVWPPDRFAAVIGDLEGKWGIKVVLCGTAYDRSILDAVQSQTSTRIRTVILGESVADFAAILEASLLCISNDSGPRHLAAALGVSSVAILPKHNRNIWGTYGRWSEILTAEESCPACPPDRCLDCLPEGQQFGSWCMRMVEVESVLDRIKRVLQK